MPSEPPSPADELPLPAGEAYLEEPGAVQKIVTRAKEIYAERPKQTPTTFNASHIAAILEYIAELELKLSLRDRRSSETVHSPVGETQIQE